jgi:hypothetical protein
LLRLPVGRQVAQFNFVTTCIYYLAKLRKLPLYNLVALFHQNEQNGTRMTRIRLIYTDSIGGYPLNPRHPRAIFSYRKISA